MGTRANAFRAGLGAFFGSLGSELEDDRRQRRAYDQEMATQQMTSRSRLGEMTLRQVLDQMDPEARARATKGRAEAGKAGIELETLQSLAPEQRQALATAPATNAAASLTQAQAAQAGVPIRQQQADTAAAREGTGAAREKRLGDTDTGNRDRPAGFAENESQWKTDARTLEGSGRVGDAYWLGFDLNLSDDPKSPWYSSAFKSWVATTYKPWVASRVKADGGGLPDLGELEGKEFVGPRAPQEGPGSLSAAGQLPAGFSPPQLGEVPAPKMPAAVAAPASAPPAAAVAAPQIGSTGAGPRSTAAAQRAVSIGKARSVDEALQMMRAAGIDTSL